MGHASAVGRMDFGELFSSEGTLIDESLRVSWKEVSAGWDSEGELEFGRKPHRFHPHTLGDPLHSFNTTEILGPVSQLLCSGLNCVFHAFDGEPSLSPSIALYCPRDALLRV